MKSNGEPGECPLGVLATEEPVESWPQMVTLERFVSDARREGFVPLLLFCFIVLMSCFWVNLSSHRSSLALWRPSWLLRIVANFIAFSLISSRVRKTPFSHSLTNQLPRARSMSCTLPPFGRLGGEALGSLRDRYLSFWRRTLETVLLGLDNAPRGIRGPKAHTFFRHRTNLHRC